MVNRMWVFVRPFRFYQINGSLYPSVTSIISIRPNQALERWKQSLTTTQVQAVQEYTSHRGILIHWGCLKQYETSEIIQDELEQESINFFKKHPQMKQ